MTTQQQVLVEKEIHIAARPETVFPFFTDSAKISQWFGSHALLEPRPGGVFRVAINSDTVARGEFVTIEPHHRVAFTFGWEGDDNITLPGSSHVEVTLTPDAAGTLVRLVHTQLKSQEIADRHAQGWGHYLPRLAMVALGQDPGPDAMGGGC
jgi:uncharacterized protein YndB with AHSA1/START domain